MELSKDADSNCNNGFNNELFGMNTIEYRGTTTVNGMKIEISVTIEKLSDENIAEAKAIVGRVLEEISK